MKPTHLCLCCATLALVTLAVPAMVGAVLVQPYNYMLDDSALTNQHDSSGSLSPFLNDASASSNEQQADRDIVSIIGDSLARLRFARMLDQQQQQQQQQQQDNNQQSAGSGAELSQEMSDLIQEEREKQANPLSSSMASMLMNVAQAAANAAAVNADEHAPQVESDNPMSMSSRGSILELDTSQANGVNAAASPSKSDLKSTGPTQWYNPKETIPVLKISSMATPSKYKKVYFRSEKKLVDGAFHSPSGSESSDSNSGSSKKSSLVKSFGQSAAAASNVQRRSSRGSGSAAPPGVLQDGVIDFLKKFRDVYVQTRPAGSSAGQSSGGPLNFASSVVSAAASSPLASFLAPASNSNSRPNLMGALQMVGNSASLLSQAAAGSGASSSSSSTSSSSGSGASGGSAALTAAATAAAAGAGNAAATGNKSPLSAQNYVSFWSKTFPTWVRKMLKQMRRRSLYNSSKRQQHQHHHNQHHNSATGVGQKLASNAISGAIDAATASSSSSSSS